MKVGFLGMGVMGLPMAKNLVKKAGCEILGFDVVEKQREAFAAAGGTAVSDASTRPPVQLSAVPTLKPRSRASSSTSAARATASSHVGDFSSPSPEGSSSASAPHDFTK